jgi:hypothetical protein
VKGQADASATAVAVDYKASDFEMTVYFVGMGAFPIQPGPWWKNAGLVSNFKDKLKVNHPDFFSDSGSLARRASSVVLGFEPTVSLKMSAADYNRLKSAWQASGSTTVSAGPFSFGASFSANDKKDKIKYSDADSTVTIGPIKSTMPVLLGVISSKLS